MSALSRVSWDAQVFAFAAEDTSGAIDCRLYSPGEGVTRYLTPRQSEYEAELYDEMAEYAEEAGVEMAQPEPATIVDRYEDLFESLELPTVVLTLGEDRSVVASEENASQIEARGSGRRSVAGNACSSPILARVSHATNHDAPEPVTDGL